eukprot:TRINITY_DN2278_c0_g1_i3.p1 TRINITY_DN2278_c0_g1~~TRINITY_DN2278_c0_g1_i3.p1  ORF type:complete len:143 (-),score=32.59 TRINITY_DN2278_c0_g1_i3:127-555(-)
MREKLFGIDHKLTKQVQEVLDHLEHPQKEKEPQVLPPPPPRPAAEVRRPPPSDRKPVLSSNGIPLPPPPPPKPSAAPQAPVQPRIFRSVPAKQEAFEEEILTKQQRLKKGVVTVDKANARGAAIAMLGRKERKIEFKKKLKK